MSSNESKQLKAGAILSYVQTIVSTLLGLIYTPAMLSLLGKTEYGLYNIAATVVSYVNLLNMGFSNSYVRFYARDKSTGDEKALARTNGLFLLVFIVIGILALLAGSILTVFAEVIFDDGLSASEYITIKKIMAILTVSTAYNLTTSIFSSIVIAHEKFVFHRVINLFRTVFSPALIWILLLCGYKSIMMASVTALLTIIADTFYMIYCFSVIKIKISMRNPSISQLKEIAVFSGFIALNTIVSQINWSVGKILLGRMWGAAYSAVYSVAAHIHSLFMQIPSAISDVFIPRCNHLVAENHSDDELTDFFIRIGRLQLAVILPILLGFIFMGQSFISLWTPNGYEDVYAITLLLIVPVSVPMIQNIGISIQMAKNKHQFRSLVYTAMALLNLVASIFLCRKFGAVGCAIGTAVSMVLANGIIMNIYYHKVIKLNMIAFWKSMSTFLPTGFAAAVVGFIIMKFIPLNTWLMFFVCGIAFCIVYITVLWFTGLNDSEKSLIYSVLKKFGVKKKG